MVIYKNLLSITNTIVLVILNTVVALASVTAIPDTTYTNVGVNVTTPELFTFRKNYITNEKVEFNFDCRINNISPNILPDFYLVNQDSSVLIAVEIYEIHIDKSPGFTRYTYDKHSSILYDVSTYSSTNLPIFLPLKKLQQSNADRLGQYVHKCKLVDSEFTQVIAQQYLKFNHGYLKVHYLAKSHVDNLAEIVESHTDFIRFDNSLEVNDDLKAAKKHFVNIDNDLVKSHLSKAWNRGGLYHGLWYFTGEQYAFQIDSVIVSLQFPSNKIWPYFNYVTFAEQRWSNTEAWEKANKDFTKYLVISKGKYKKIPKKELRKLNADEGYSFDFSHPLDDLYRNTYRDCKVFLMHKNNVGSIIIKYYYKPEDSKTVNQIIKKTLGQIAFYDQSLFDQLGDKVYPY